METSGRTKPRHCGPDRALQRKGALLASALFAVGPCCAPAQPNSQPTSLSAAPYSLSRHYRGGHYAVYLTVRRQGRTHRLLRLPVAPLDYGIQDRLFRAGNQLVALVNVADIFYEPFFIGIKSGVAHLVPKGRFDGQLGGRESVALGDVLMGQVNLSDAVSDPRSFVYRFGPRSLEFGEVFEDVTEVAKQTDQSLTLFRRRNGQRLPSITLGLPAVLVRGWWFAAPSKTVDKPTARSDPQ